MWSRTLLDQPRINAALEQLLKSRATMLLLHTSNKKRVTPPRRLSVDSSPNNYVNRSRRRVQTNGNVVGGGPVTLVVLLQKWITQYMNQEQESDSTYRFAAFGASGTITLKSDCVHIRTRSYLGWWEQTIPLEHISPNYATLIATPHIYIWAWIFAILFAWLGIYGIIWGIAAYPQQLVSVFLLLFGAWFMWYLYRHRKTEWIMFVTNNAGHGVNYTRQGPDELTCDDFTRQMVESINANCHPEKSRTMG